MSLKVVSIGAAVQDVYLCGRVLTPIEQNGEYFEELKIGDKADLEEIFFSTGGGATNAAVTFARQGLTSSFMGQIGRDPAGRAVMEALNRERVDTDLVIYSEKHATAYSVILLAPDGGRTILTYRGASSEFEREKFSLDKIHADWIYISSLAGNIGLLEEVVNYAVSKHIKVSINPGGGELQHKGRLLNLLSKITILSVNKEEAQQLFDAENSWDLIRLAIGSVPIVVITDGPHGSVAAQRTTNQICSAGMYEDVPVIDRTGAGDAFASGFTAKIIVGATLQDALVFASANSTSVVSQRGAKNGIIKGDVPLHGMDLHCEPLNINRQDE